MHLVVTDSGLGGLVICAQLERALRDGAAAPGLRLTYVNAWPEEGRGYNSLPDTASRARVFDGALRRIDAMRPDAIVLACNTLSILYELTEYRTHGVIPVHGIIDAGLSLFEEALRAQPGSALIVLGTRTTVESGVHRQRLVERGIGPERIGGASCHGLATAIEHGPAGRDVAALIDTCAAAAAAAAPAGEPLFAGLCCTHYAMVEDAMRDALAGHGERTVGTLDPNARLVTDVAEYVRSRGRRPNDDSQTRSVDVISKVRIAAAQQEAIGGIVEPISPAIADALRHYRHVPDLF